MRTDDLIALMAGDNADALAEAARERRLAIAALMAAILAVAVVFFVGVGVRQSIGDPFIFAAVARKEAITLAMVAAGLVGMLTLSQPNRRRTLVWLAPVVTLVAMVGWEVARYGFIGVGGRINGANAFACLVTIPLFAILPLVALLYGLRQGAPTAPGWAGAAAGLCASGIGASLYALHCTDDSMFFVTVWYGLATLGLVGLGALLGERFLRW